MRIHEILFGAALSFLSFEIWNDIIISIIIAFAGGIAAAAGKKIHDKIYTYIKNRKSMKSLKK